MIVGLSKDRRRRRHDGREAQDDRCRPVDKLLSSEHADVLRDSVAWLGAWPPGWWPVVTWHAVHGGDARLPGD
jgi:hypothetical protein